MIKINGVELEFDVLDADDQAREEKAKEALGSIDLKNCVLNSETIRTYCQNVFEYFNTIFGPGTDRKIFGDKVNILKCVQAVAEFKDQLAQETAAVTERMKKYAPARAARH